MTTTSATSTATVATASAKRLAQTSASTPTVASGPAATTPATTAPAGSVSASTSASSSSVPFAADSPWRTTLPADAPLDPDSAAIVGNLAGQIRTYYGGVAFNSYSYSAPIYTVPAGQPTVNMTWSNCQGKNWLDPLFAADLQNVPIPADAVPSEGSDAAMVIYQPSSDTEWEFWKAQQSNGTWSACWGGRIQNVAQSMGTFSGATGASASGLPLLGYLIRVSDLQSGSINHTVNLELPKARSGAWSWPAQRTDGWVSDPTAPAEGERFRLPASLNLAQFNLTPGELMVAKALQTYGAIITDSSGSVAMQAEDPRPYEVDGAGDPYAPYFSGPQYNWLKDIPWQDLEAVAWNYGAPGS